MSKSRNTRSTNRTNHQESSMIRQRSPRAIAADIEIQFETVQLCETTVEVGKQRIDTVRRLRQSLDQLGKNLAAHTGEENTERALEVAKRLVKVRSELEAAQRCVPSKSEFLRAGDRLHVARVHMHRLYKELKAADDAATHAALEATVGRLLPHAAK